MRALRTVWADGCSLRWKRASAAFVFEGLPDFPPGRNKRKTDGDRKRRRCGFLWSGGSGVRLQAESLSDGLVDRDFADGALPVRSDWASSVFRTEESWVPLALPALICQSAFICSALAEPVAHGGTYGGSGLSVCFEDLTARSSVIIS
jgi:hypothetical protein